MLGMEPCDDEDEDNHLCIKCNSTIIGLDNYIKHRKERCGKNKYQVIDTEKIITSKTSFNDPHIETLDQHYNLGADVFFQSLELQSSSKRNPLVRASSPLDGGKLARSNVPHQSISTALLSKDANVSPIEISAQGQDWIGGHSLRDITATDNQTKLINAVNNISGAAKKELSRPTFTIMDDYKNDDDFNDESEDSDDLEGEETHPSGGKWKPSPSHTGGKWRPGGRETVHWPSQQLITPEPEHVDDWELQEEHTGGKWKPVTILSHSDNYTKLDKITELDEDENDAYMPPPGHTKGKWLPGANVQTKSDHKTQIMDTTVQTKGSVQYWCGPCNRRLGSRSIYEKHLSSNLHFKRILPENELEYSGHLDKTIEKVQKDKREKKPSQFVNDSVYTQIKRNKRQLVSKESDKSLGIKKRKRQPVFVHCLGCKSRVRLHLMGKHLISHYHFRKSNSDDEKYRQMVLENIEAVVHQSPFQCSPCKFYTNHQSTFMHHWFSTSHEEKMKSIEGNYWCSFCNFESERSSAMVQHITGGDHQEVAAAINRSMPIIIRRKTILRCDACKQRFKYNIQLKYHAMKTGHPLSFTASDQYQEMRKCRFCDLGFKSSLKLTAHLRKDHKQDLFFCHLCSLSFLTAKQAKEHRHTQEHRLKHKMIHDKSGSSTDDLARKCPHCNAPHLKNILELKKHIHTQHPDIKHSCPKCGMSFVLSQDVSSHVRKKECSYQSKSSDSSKPVRTCSQCPFQTESKAEHLFHEALHTDPVIETRKVKGKDVSILKYKCLFCSKLFVKPSLRCHLRKHTLEAPYSCKICSAKFTRHSSLVSHVKVIHDDDYDARADSEAGPSSSESKKSAEDSTVSYLCSECGASFDKHRTLTRHARTHLARELKCSRADCVYTARTPSELSEHEQAVHAESREHACNHPPCQYAAKTKRELQRHIRLRHAAGAGGGVETRRWACSQCPFVARERARLERHARTHAGARPYACPHCDFTCAWLENLRKHALKTSKHPGKMLYSCRECAGDGIFQTNFANELRNHLLQQHSNKFNYKLANEFVAQYLMIEKSSKDYSTSADNKEGRLEQERAEESVAPVMVVQIKDGNLWWGD